MTADSSLSTYTEKIHKPGSSLYYSLLFLKPSIRQAILALYAFYFTVNNILLESEDSGVARLQLHWWQTEVDRLFAKQAMHPVTKAIQSLLTQYDLPQHYFHDLIQSTLDRLQVGAFSDLTQLKEYFHKTLGSNIALIQCITQPTIKVDNHALESALGMTDAIRNIRNHLKHQSHLIPLDHCDGQPLLESDLTPNNRRLIRALESLANEAKRAFDMFQSTINHHSIHHAIYATLKQRSLSLVIASQFQVLRESSHLTPLKKFWIAQRIYRHQNTSENIIL